MTSKTNSRAVRPMPISNLQIEAQRLRAEAMADVIFAVGHGLGRLFAPLVRIGKRAAETIARQQEVDRIHAELARMTDRDLADIGIGRSDIWAIAQGTYRRDAAEAAPVVELRPAAKPQADAEDLPRAA